MESFFSRYKNALVLILVLLVQVVGVAVQVRRPLSKEHAQPDAGGVRLIRYWAISLVSPPERLLHWVGGKVYHVWSNYIDLIHVHQENEELQAELKRLRIEEGGIAEDARQGQRLQQLLAFEEKYIYKTVPAQIIGTSGTEQSRILSIDKGSREGVGVDMPVITSDGIVGRIREVFPHTSQVLEISDPTSGAGVILATTRIRGILRGNASGQPQIVGIMPDERIKSGEPVVTSGGDQIFPRGMAVGYVDRVVTDPERDPLVDVMIRPAANLSRLEEVLVITDMGSDVTPKEKLDLAQSEATASVEQLKASEILAERLPSRIDPDAPEDQASETATDNSDGEASRPMQPPPALHPDRFSPNASPPAASLTPGARAAAQSEGTEDKKPAVAAKPRPVIPSGDNADNGETAATSTSDVPKRKAPELVPDDGSRPSTTVATHSANTTPRPAATQAGSGDTSSNPAASDSASSVKHTAASQAPSGGDGASSGESKPKVVVDGPLPFGAKKVTPSTSAAPAQHKVPELVPDDGSRPPTTTKPKPQTQPTPASQQPQGGPQR